MNDILVPPPDQFNTELIAQTHPPDWTNPTPRGTYNLVVIGAGTAGIISALGTAGLGGKVALIERHLLGGDCLNYGCVPSKALLRASRTVHHTRWAGRFGIEAPDKVNVDFAAVMQRMRRLRAQISHHDSAQRFTSLGVDVFFGDAKFVSPHAIEVAGTRLDFRRCVIASGGRARPLDVPGAQEVGYLTNETVFSLTALPPRLIVIGGGPIGCELAQAFAAFGSQVTLLERGTRLLSRAEPDAAALVAEQFARDGVQVQYNVQLKRLESDAGGKRVVVERDGQELSLETDELLVAVGRIANVEGLELAVAGVEQNKRGVVVDDFLRTSNPHILAAGDVAGSYQFTHAADAMARICIQNAFFFGRKRLSGLIVPSTTYTTPQVAGIGLTAAQCAQQNLAIDTYREELKNVDRAILDGELAGFALVHCRRGTGQVVGATIVNEHAGDMIGELSLLMTSKLSLAALSNAIHCYPTHVEILKRLGDQYQRARLTPRIASWLRWVLQWR
jgi:pyruvate/2-oxoglutarate dehydrogenase complex dihydrolipoamide dehydrogenase (E3) component